MVGDGSRNVIVDHCSVSWGVDETFSINKGSNLTVQWCMVTESLYHSLHKKGNHGYGGLWGGPGGSTKSANCCKIYRRKKRIRLRRPW